MKKLLLLLILFVPLFASAFSAELFVDTGNVRINTLAGVVHIPRGAKIEKVFTGNSAILLWINEPVIDQESETIRFSGITPGGFLGRRTVITLSGEFDETDLSNFSFSEVTALKDDGKGTFADINLSLQKSIIEKDDAPPEPFTIAISHSPYLFDGNKFVYFAAQDKGQGIARYEKTTSWLFSPGNNNWQPIESPNKISFIESFKTIYIRAVDKQGNYRVASVEGDYHYIVEISGTIILLCVLYVLLKKYSFLL